MIMGYLNATLTNTLILFLKITKCDQFILILKLYRGKGEATRDENVTEMEIIYRQIFCVKTICKILVEAK